MCNLFPIQIKIANIRYIRVITKRMGSTIIKLNVTPCSYIRNVDRIQSATAIKGTLPNTCHTIRNSHCYQVITTNKCIIVYRFYPIRYDKVCNLFPIQIKIANIRYTRVITKRMGSTIIKLNVTPCSYIRNVDRIQSATG